MLKDFSFRLGLLIGSNPGSSIFCSFAVLIFCAMGWINVRITDDPQLLWVPADS